MNRPESATIAPRDAGAEGPLFDAPWQAQVLGLANGLTVAGLFTAGDWANALGSALREAYSSGAPDDQATYYAATLVALEQLVGEHAPEISDTLESRIEQWRRAYLRTPHGKPVLLAAGADPAVPSSHAGE